MTTYTETGRETETWDIEVVVTGAESEEQARELSIQYAGWGTGRYQVGDATVEVFRTLVDNEQDWNEDGEWEPDEDEDEEGAR